MWSSFTMGHKTPVKSVGGIWVAFANIIVWTGRTNEGKEKKEEQGWQKVSVFSRKWGETEITISNWSLKTCECCKEKYRRKNIICWYCLWVPDNSCWSCLSSFRCQPKASDRRITDYNSNLDLVQGEARVLWGCFIFTCLQIQKKDAVNICASLKLFLVINSY